MQLSLRDLAQMTAAQRDTALSALVAHATGPRDGQADWLNDQIRECEVRHELSSAVMCERFARGEIRETGEIAEWLILLDVRERARRSR